MTTTASPSAAAAPLGYDPDEFRMTMGEHLEELRRRIVLGLIGVIVAGGGCLLLGDRLIGLFTRPLVTAMLNERLNPQFFFAELSEGFSVYIKISLICAATIASPWIVYQLWLFIAAGLYPKERRYITKYVPLSLSLVVASVLFVYYIVLPWTIVFFLKFNDSIPLPRQAASHVATNLPAGGLFHFPILDGDPPVPTRGDVWFNEPEGRLKMFLGVDRSGEVDLRVIPFGPSKLLSPHLSLPEYIDLVLTTLLTFGLCFQLPLVVLTLVRIGIVPIETLRTGRRYVYFGLVVLAATMTPGDVITAMIALTVPLVLLYEMGIALAAWSAPVAEESAE